MRILLISPHDNTYRFERSAFKRSLNYYALTLPTLAALVPPELNATVRAIDEGVEPLQGLADADLVAITAVTASAPRAYALAAQARALGKTVVMGGPHVTLLPEEAAQHAHAIATGFADASWPALLHDFAVGRLQARYAQDTADIDLAHVPQPRRDVLRLQRYLPVPVVLASRGCPNTCSFCAIPVLWGRRFHHRPVQAVIDELRSLGSKTVLFIDPALAEDEAYARELLTAMIPLGLRWAGLTTVTMALNPALLDLACRSGCMGLLVGFETLSQRNLQAIGKRFNLAHRYLEAVRAMHARCIRVLGTFVFGLDSDDADVFARTADFVEAAQIDLVRYAVFTPFPGTPVFRKLEREGRILTRDWSRYTTEEVVFQPRSMSAQALAEGLRQAWARTYQFSSIARRARIWHADGLFTLAANLGFRHYARRVLGPP